ncbi:MAG: WYL domain-containing protein [Oscillospiraceae bacterium]|nr:WYL domain-containing protein [Oscillospiraceae bacterium]
MYTIPPKKLVTINILNILKKYSDENHRLTQQRISELLKSEYLMDVDRKTVKRNLMNLLDIDDKICYTEDVRKGRNGEDITVYSDWYYYHDFDNSEIRLLIDSLFFSKHIPYSQCKQLAQKLSGLSNVYFGNRIKHIRSLPENQPENKELFYTIDILDEAIDKNKKVLFTYNSFGTDKKLHPRKTEKYLVNPYQMAAANGRYYLIGNVDKYNDIAHFRIDRITAIELTDESRKPLKNVKGTEHGLTLPKHMAEHIYMFSGESVRVEMQAEKYIVSDLIDWFGKDIRFKNESENHVTAVVTVNETAIRKWALQYALHVRIIAPQELADNIKQDLREAMKNYEIL